MGRDFAVRVMRGTRVSLSVGLLASVSAFAGGWVDNIMMRITDILYTIPDILLIILLAMAIKEPLENLATQPGFGWMQKLGPNMVSIFIIFALLYWVGMARIVRSQKAPADQLHRHPDRYHHAADPLLHLYRELPELPGPGRCGPHAVSGLSGHRRC